jgi:hypothetical protein
MKHLLAALLLSTMTLACTKTSDVAVPATGSAGDPAPAAAAAPTSAPAAPAPAAAAPAASSETPTATTTAAPSSTPEATPDLVEAAPGVQVIADYDAPVFFNGGRYWRHNDGGWYSSSIYTGGWELQASPPSVIVNIDRPERFVHYRPTGYVVRNRPAPQREWHPAPIRAEIHADVPHPEVRVEPPRAGVRVEPPRAGVRVEPPRADVRVDPHAEVHVHN